jgi:pimeloyl-ACP methyl ester carboxylesterase
MADAFRERTVAAQDGLKLHVRDWGAPSPIAVLCLGGLTRNCKDFDHLARHLADRRRVVCPDYRGRGLSERDPNWRNYIAPTYLSDILHILAALGVHRIAVIGTSLGGLLAMGLAVAAPSSLAGVVLNDIGPELNAAALAPIIDYVRTDHPQPDIEVATAEMRRLMPTLAFRDAGAFRQLAENTYRLGEDGLLHCDWDPAIVRPILAGTAPSYDLWRLFGALGKVPALSIRGELSAILTRDTADRMAAAHPGLMRLEVAGTGHAPTLDEPECRARIDAFLDEVLPNHA